MLAAGIAAVATATALAWSDQLLAGMGLVGAILAPVTVAVRDDRLATTGVAFALLMLAATIAVSLHRSWRILLVVATVCAGVQVAALLDDAAGREGAALALAIVLWALVLGTGVFESLRRERVTRLSASYVILGSAFSGYAAAVLYEDRALGVALMASALVNGALAAVLFGRARDLASLLWATALALAAVGTAQLLSEATLTVAWAAEATVLAWLAVRLREPRFRLAALAWLTLALLHSLAFDAPVSLLFHETAHPASAVPSLLALIAAAALTGLLGADLERETGESWVAFAVNVMLHVGRQTRLVLFALAGLLAIEAASLTVLELVPSWDWGHVAVTGLWGLVALGLMLGGLPIAGMAWAGATVALAVIYDVGFLSGDARWCSLAVAAATALIAALLYERELGPESVAGATIGAALAVAAGLGIAGHDLQWLLVLAVGALYLALGAAFLRPRRDQSTLLWSIGLTLGVAAAVAAARRLVARARAHRRSRDGGAAGAVRGAARLRRTHAARPRARRDARHRGDAARPLHLPPPPRCGRAGGARGRRRGGALRGAPHPVSRDRGLGGVGGRRLRGVARDPRTGRDAQRLGGHELPARPHGGQRLLGPDRTCAAVRRPRAPGDRVPARRLRPLRRQPREALRLRPRLPQLGRPRALVPRSWRPC